MHISRLGRTGGRALTLALVLALLFSFVALFAPTEAFAEDQQVEVSDGAEQGAVAEAQPQSVETALEGYSSTAQVSGTIAGVQGLPAGNLSLRLVPKAEASWGGGQSIGAVDRATGKFRISGVPAGSYALKVEVAVGYGEVVWSQYLNDGSSYAVDTKAGIETKLTLAAAVADARLSGTISFIGSDYRPGESSVRAEVMQRLGADWYLVSSTAMDAMSRAYASSNLVPGEYTVRFVGTNPCMVASFVPGFEPDETYWDYNACGFGDQWWNAKHSAQAATVINLASGQQAGGIDGTLNTNHIDVRWDRKFAGDIDWMYERKISTGYRGPNGNVYQPRLPVTREAMAAFIYRYAGKPAFTPPSKPSFADVPSSAKFYKEIEWMKSKGLTTGIRAGGTLVYAPKDSISRQAMAAFLYRLAGKPQASPNAQTPFNDVPKTAQFANEIAWMSRTGITTGVKTPQGLQFQPLAPVKRDAMAAFLHRYDIKLGQ